MTKVKQFLNKQGINVVELRQTSSKVVSSKLTPHFRIKDTEAQRCDLVENLVNCCQERPEPMFSGFD